MDEARWILGIVLLTLAFYIAVLNWKQFVLAHLLGRSARSWIPLLGGVAGSAGLIVVPSNTMNSLWWIPPLIDWGCIPGLLFTCVWHMKRVLCKKSDRSGQ